MALTYRSFGLGVFRHFFSLYAEEGDRERERERGKGGKGERGSRVQQAWTTRERQGFLSSCTCERKRDPMPRARERDREISLVLLVCAGKPVSGRFLSASTLPPPGCEVSELGLREAQRGAMLGLRQGDLRWMPDEKCTKCPRMV